MNSHANETVEQFQARMYDEGRYAEMARRVNLAMHHHDQPCTDSGCDPDSPCPRHELPEAPK